MTEHLALKVEHTLQAVESFSTLLEQETEALKTSNYSTFESLQDEKLVRAKNYQDAVLAFESDIDILKSLEEGLKTKLRAAHARFTAAAQANENILLATKNVAERIVTMIMTAARQTVAQGPNYGANGMQGLSEKIPVHFKHNEVL